MLIPGHDMLAHFGIYLVNTNSDHFDVVTNMMIESPAARQVQRGQGSSAPNTENRKLSKERKARLIQRQKVGSTRMEREISPLSFKINSPTHEKEAKRQRMRLSRMAESPEKRK